MGKTFNKAKTAVSKAVKKARHTLEHVDDNQKDTPEIHEHETQEVPEHEHKWKKGKGSGERLMKFCTVAWCGKTELDITPEEWNSIY